jgi:tetratricopeptide (TPR) repeat protein
MIAQKSDAVENTILGLILFATESFFRPFPGISKLIHLRKLNRFRGQALIMILLLIGTLPVKGQNADSLARVAAAEPLASKRFELWSAVGSLYGIANNDSGQAIANQKMLSAAFSTHNDTTVGVAYLMLGIYAEDKADFMHSLEYHFKSLQVFERLGYKIGICQSAEQIAVVYKQLKNSGEALRFLLKAKQYLAIPEVAASWVPRAVYSNMSEVYLLEKKADSALVCAQKANEVTNKESDPFGYSRVLLNFGLSYAAKGDNDLAETYLKKTILFSASVNEYINLVSGLSEYSQFLFKNGRTDSAKVYALRGLAEHENLNTKAGTLSIELTGTLSQIYSKLGLFDSAYFYAQLNNAYRDTVFNNQRLNSIQDMTFTQRIHETEELRKQQESEIKAHQTLQYILIGISLIVFLILFILMSNSIVFHTRQIRFFGVVGLLLVFEFVNLLLHPFLEDATHHSPVLMLILLVLLAALLVPLHHKIEKWVTKKMTEKNNRIRLANAKKTIEKLEPKSEVDAGGLAIKE